MKLSEVDSYLEGGEYARRESWVPRMYIRRLGITDNIEFVIFDDDGTVLTRDKWSPRIEDLGAKDYSSMSRTLEQMLKGTK
jgi:hypothetical protein